VDALITREFEQYDSAYLAHKALREKRLDALKLKLVSSEQGGKALSCSRRMITEAEWLLNYTAEWPKLDQQLAALEHSLATRDQGFALRQTPDGSWEPVIMLGSKRSTEPSISLAISAPRTTGTFSG